VEKSSVLVDDVQHPITQVSLQPFEKALTRLTFLKTLASSLFVALLFIVPLEALPPAASAVEFAFTAICLVVLFSWLCALAWMWRPAVAALSCLGGFLIFIVSAAIVTFGLSVSRIFEGAVRPDDFFTMKLALASIIPFAFCLCVAIDGFHLISRDPDGRLLATARPGVAGLSQILADAFGIHPICEWLPRSWRSLLARTLFVLSALARGLTICVVLGYLLLPATVSDATLATIDKIVTLIVICLCVGLVAVLRFLARRFARVSVETLVQEDQRTPVLFLRSFKDDQVRLPRKGAIIPFFDLRPNGIFGIFRAWMGIGEPSPLLDHVVLDEATPLGPVVAIGVPGSPPPFGVARTYLNDDEWQDGVEQLASTSRAIVIVLDETAGVKWEDAHIQNSQYAAKTLYLLPPPFASPAASSVFLDHYLFKDQSAGDYGKEIVRRSQLANSCMGWYQTSEGKIVLLTSDGPTAAGYIGALRLFQAYQMHGYAPVGKQPEFVEASVPAKLDRRDIDSLYRTTRGIVIRLNDGRVLAPVDGEYRLFRSAVEYRDLFHEQESWGDVTDEAEKKSFLLSQPAIFGEMAKS
jgi:hypothetical protein